MNLEENFKKIKEEVPEVNPNLEEKIYRSVPQKKLRNPIWNKLTIAICGMVLLVLACVIGPIVFHQVEQNNIKSTAVLLKDVISPAEKPSQSLGEFYDKLNAFSAELSYQYLQNMDSAENAVLSPVSIFSALALATECSSIEAREEILNAIGMDYELLKRNYGYLYQTLNQITTDERGKKASEFKLTNSIWIDKNLEYKKTCIESLADDFYCYSHSTDFKNSLASKYIQDFIKKQTYGLIDLNLEFPPETIFVLLNTLYLKDIWNAFGGELNMTKEKHSFLNYNSSVTQKNFLIGNYQAGKVLEQETFKQFYIDAEKVRITFIVPKEGYTIDEVFTANAISNIYNQKYISISEEEKVEYWTRCIFPEFNAHSSKTINSLLESKFGLEKIFQIQNKPLSNLTSNPAYCSKIIHEAKLEVNRKGIEGAAVTAAISDSGPGFVYEKAFEDFIIDKSFGFVVTFQNRTSNLFSGIIRTI